jgi:Protein of unknown function (DUF3828)
MIAPADWPGQPYAPIRLIRTEEVRRRAMDRGLLNRRFMNRALAMQAVLVAASAMAVAASAEPVSPQPFIDGIYKHYLGKDSKGLSLSSAAVIRRYFAPPLADAIIKDFAQAHKAGEVPLLNGDPFIDAQDWEIENLKTSVKSSGANTAVATVSFVMFMKPRTVTLSLVNSAAGWRIADIRWARGSLRALYKLK